MKYFLPALCLILGACSSVPREKGFNYKPLKADYFNMVSLVKDDIHPGEPLRFYIEGNSVESFLFKTPKPRNKIGLKLALRDKNTNVIYIARPCQYIQNDNCIPYVWENGRYSREVVNAVKKVVDHYLTKYQSKEAFLIGYGGGGTVAALVSTRMKGFPVKLITVSGILDTRVYTTYHGQDYYSDSLNPANENYLLSGIPQIHYVGGQDKDFPEAFTKDFVNKLPNPLSVQVKRLPSATHDNWLEKNFSIQDK
ncbi:MAG: hypothetical protein EOM53_00665 [Alphaproteobacteria bacterium]|nr:hypothetical protein [Alphaproteobacteria bacterium]